jgi:hypothetical protein
MKKAAPSCEGTAQMEKASGLDWPCNNFLNNLLLLFVFYFTDINSGSIGEIIPRL